jgi:hypothetical protein
VHLCELVEVLLHDNHDKASIHRAEALDEEMCDVNVGRGTQVQVVLGLGHEETAYLEHKVFHV